MDQGPTFISRTGQGFPDLTLLSTSCQDLLESWRVLDKETFSDHRYVCVRLAGDFSFAQDFIFKTKFNTKKFLKLFKKDFEFLQNLCNSISSKEEIDNFYSFLINSVKEAAFGAFKKKPLSKTRVFKFWNSELRIYRNRVTALYKKYNSLKRNGELEVLVQAEGITYRKERSELKKLINLTKRKAWEAFCSRYQIKYGHTFKVAFQKYKRNSNLNINIPNILNPDLNTKANFMLNSFFPDYALDEFDDLVFSSQSLREITILEIDDLFKNLKGGKAPGLDRIDYNIWLQLFKLNKNFFCDIINVCFRFSYFPITLRNSKVFFLLKPGRDPSVPNSYRPICLLPTLGKIIERLFITQFNEFISLHSLVHPHQFGFRELSNCEVAVNHLVTKIKASREGCHVALVSVDIRAAFDSLDWVVLFGLFDKYNFPENIKSFIYSYLSNRTVSFPVLNDVVSKGVCRGCPQGSVLAPHLWNFYFNEILLLNNDRWFLQAYADDLALVLSASSRKLLESVVSNFLDVLFEKLMNLNLIIASEKTLAVVFRGTQNKNKQKRGLATLQRPPIFKIQGRTIRTVDSLKYLGIVIDNLLNWNSHIIYLQKKVYNLIRNFNSVSGPNWGTGVPLLKHWYSSVIQPSLLFGAAVWGGSFTQQQILKLHTIQRVALLKISKAYKTCPTNALNVFLGIPPLHVVANSLYKKFHIWFKRNSIHDFIEIENLDYFIRINNIELKYRVIEFPETIHNADYIIYTDGSGIDGNVGAAVCIFNNDNFIKAFMFKLRNFNSVFQAELSAINFAVGWALENCCKVNILTDSFSSIQVLKKSNSKSYFINNIKNKMYQAFGSVGLSWVKVHAGIPGNELADHYAKKAINEGEDLFVPAPYSYLKKYINKLTVIDWQRHWEGSKTGNRVREFVPFVDLKLLTHNRFLLFFVSGHGPFPLYLFRFKILNSPNCVCGGLGSPDHFVFDCPLTAKFHMTAPTGDNKKLWFKNVLRNEGSLYRLQQICKIADNICTELKSG
ncbi:Putative protein in type-1 retrotransposable element R1DM [Araneus ventricosus]|uniref:Retrovirus-related Pol polyprotein from type-1 retrotransposable element R1 n=1 Tax=Araneus ventricosus TaxID=182803 RepID=A0A4Y2IWW8_ARAVE|nr:Putative protein in type-1 retrotransposable element R1DM [Araneus ventricosus]